jgi:hypothetical protein
MDPWNVMCVCVCVRERERERERERDMEGLYWSNTIILPIQKQNYGNETSIQQDN